LADKAHAHFSFCPSSEFYRPAFHTFNYSATTFIPFILHIITFITKNSVYFCKNCLKIGIKKSEKKKKFRPLAKSVKFHGEAPEIEAWN